ncbi:MAG: NAD-dependent epimerase/dehydratase family protein, partial [Salinispira sp.]
LGSRRDRKILKPFRKQENLEILEGDLRNVDDIRKGVKGADYVLHLGAVIPPASDSCPETTESINLGGTLNIIRAIKEQENPDAVRLVYIATVASMGNRPSPVHWGRTGDPIKVSRFDSYAASKVKAERAVIESGLKHWVSLRQSGMLHKDMLTMRDPIIFHQPLNNHVEWSTSEDSGEALYNLCTTELPDRFWRNMYNLGSGPEFRETYYSFLKGMFKKMGIDIHKIFKPSDFSTQNFHCVWYMDSDILNNWLHFRKSAPEDFQNTLKVPLYYKLSPLFPPVLLRTWFMEPLLKKENGTFNWIKNNITEKINAFWGSLSNWKKLPREWGKFIPIKNPSWKIVDRGFDDTKAPSELILNDCRAAARFRGGQCLSIHMKKGGIFVPLKWKCACGYTFNATANLVLRGGHWCPVCDLNSGNYEARAKRSMFFAQVFEQMI